jgi:hypothetical protein
MKKYLIRASSALFAGLLLATFYPVTEAGAVPAFARKNDMACSACHTAWPLLNSMGRQYKENGYKFSPGEEPESLISDFLAMDDDFPISAVVKARPFDKKEGSDHKIRAIHEVEIMIAGTIYKNVSGFIELEAEDEDDFVPKLLGRITWHANKAANVQLSYGSVFVSDPLDTLSGKRRMTRGRNSVIDQKFGGADNNGKLRDARQTIALYGRPMDRVFYIVGYSGNPKDAEGVNAANIHARLAVDVIDQLTVGAFGLFGKCKAGAVNCDIDRSFQRLGFDMQAEYESLILHGAYMTTKDDANALDLLGNQPEAKNSAWYVEAVYAMQKDGRPWIVPSVRLDQYEKSGGAQDFTDVTVNLSYYMAQNVRVYGEYYKQLDVPTGMTKGGRFTIQIEAGF